MTTSCGSGVESTAPWGAECPAGPYIATCGTQAKCAPLSFDTQSNILTGECLDAKNVCVDAGALTVTPGQMLQGIVENVAGKLTYSQEPIQCNHQPGECKPSYPTNIPVGELCPPGNYTGSCSYQSYIPDQGQQYCGANYDPVAGVLSALCLDSKQTLHSASLTIHPGTIYNQLVNNSNGTLAATPTCPSSPAQGLVCSGHGVCEPVSGSCSCNVGYGGADCSRKLCPPTNGVVCSGHGHCDASTGVCTCTAGYTGLDCSGAPVPVCPSSGGLVCAGHGHCDATTGVCTCTAGYTGADCSVAPPLTVCPTNTPGVECSGHGTCDPKTKACTCAPKWSGVMCDITGPPPKPVPSHSLLIVGILVLMLLGLLAALAFY